MKGQGPLTGDLAEALHGEMVPKFLATMGADGRPNIVVCTSLDAVDEHTLFFGHFLLWKTRENLERDSRVAVAVMTEDLHVWTIRGRFREFADSGPLMDRMNEKQFFKYNAYIRISTVGVIDVEEVTSTWSLSFASVALDLFPARLAASFASNRDRPALPPRVKDKFARTQALKALAYQGEDGHPRILPVFSAWPSNGDGMYFGTRAIAGHMDGLCKGTAVALNVLTEEPVSYQVKGTLERTLPFPLGRIAALRIDQVFSASPPLAGKPIEMRHQE